MPVRAKPADAANSANVPAKDASPKAEARARASPPANLVKAVPVVVPQTTISTTALRRSPNVDKAKARATKVMEEKESSLVRA